MWSKLLVLGVLSALQATLMTVIGLAGRPMPPSGSLITGAPLVELVIAMALLAIVSMTLGLLISSAVSTSEKGLPLLFVSVMAQVVFTGGVFPIAGKVGLEQVAWLSPSRWGFGAVASTTNLAVITPGSKPDALWTHSATTWLTDIGLLLALGVVFTVLTWRRLERSRPGRR
jgi:hypothetical protein